MSWRTSSFTVALRSIGRAVGLNRWLAYCLGRGANEATYEKALCDHLREGDVAWDVGANVGRYTRALAERVGAQGRVFAFEPSPENFNRLKTACGTMDNVLLLQIGLGREDRKLFLKQGHDKLGATSRVVADDSSGITVDVRAAANVIEAGEAPIPNAIKIDVEGFEQEVLEGLGRFLREPDLRTVGVEVHFGILKERGLAQVPRRLEKTLKESGFKLDWIDSSHIIATRTDAVRSH